MSELELFLGEERSRQFMSAFLWMIGTRLLVAGALLVWTLR